jgi:hypothetical protein
MTSLSFGFKVNATGDSTDSSRSTNRKVWTVNCLAGILCCLLHQDKKLSNIVETTDQTTHQLLTTVQWPACFAGVLPPPFPGAQPSSEPTLLPSLLLLLQPASCCACAFAVACDTADGTVQGQQRR